MFNVLALPSRLGSKSEARPLTSSSIPLVTALEKFCGSDTQRGAAAQLTLRKVVKLRTTLLS